MESAKNGGQGAEADVEKLLDKTRNYINAGERDQALAHLLSAIAITKGPENVLSTLDAAKTREAQREAQLKSLQKEHDRLVLAEATRASHTLCQSSSILKDHGVEEILRDAFEDGSSVVCATCHALVKVSRWDAHCNHWCPALHEDNEDFECEVSEMSVS